MKPKRKQKQEDTWEELQIDFGKVYGLLERDTWELRYVGICLVGTFEDRLKGHLKDTRAFIRHGRPPDDQTRKLNWMSRRILDDPSWRPATVQLAIVPIHALKEKERELIRYYREQGADLVNDTEGGDGTLGQVHDEFAREKMRVAAKKRWSVPISDEYREAMRNGQLQSYAANPGRATQHSKRMKEYYESQEAREKTSQAGKGIPKSDEWKQRMSELKLGTKFSDEHRASISQRYQERCPATHESGVQCRKRENHTDEHLHWTCGGLKAKTITWTDV